MIKNTLIGCSTALVVALGLAVTLPPSIGCTPKQAAAVNQGDTIAEDLTGAVCSMLGAAGPIEDIICVIAAAGEGTIGLLTQEGGPLAAQVASQAAAAQAIPLTSKKVIVLRHVPKALADVYLATYAAPSSVVVVGPPHDAATK